MSIDWSKAPKGTTHHAVGLYPGWYRFSGTEMLEYWHDGMGVWIDSLYSIENHPNRLVPMHDFQPFTSIEDAQPAPDMVNHPPHYQSDNGIECIDAIRAALGRDGFIAYCIGNSMKYQWREKADKLEDMRKAAWYLNRAIEEQSK